MAKQTNTGGGVLVTGPPLGNVEFPNSYLRIKQNFDAVYQSLQNIWAERQNMPLTPTNLNVIRDSLQANGTVPINLTGLIPPSTSIGVQRLGLHADRTAIQASSLSAGSVYFETDRTVVYIVEPSAGLNQWFYECGIMFGTTASRPSDLGAYDVGFLYCVTDRGNMIYRWSGSAWVYQFGIMIDVLANRPTLAANDAGFLFQVSDESNVIYRWSGSAWVYQMGIMSGNFSSRPSLGANDSGFLFNAQDRASVTQWNGNNWNFVIPPRVYSLQKSGNISVANDVTPWELIRQNDNASFVQAKLKSGPVGANSNATVVIKQVDAANNATSWLTLVIPDNNTYVNANNAQIAALTQMNNGSYFAVDVTAVGSNNAGADLLVTIQ